MARMIFRGLGAIILAVSLSLALAACASSTKKSPPAPGGSASASISKGIGTKDASADVKVGALDASSGFSVEVPVTITNHSSKRSHYFIDLSLESADGKTQYDTTSVFVQNLDPGQTSTEKAMFVKQSKIPKGAKVVLKSVQRTAA